MNKFVVIFGLCLFGFVSAGPVPKEFEDVAPEVRKVCMEESGTSLELIEQVAAGYFVEDDKIKCYLKCQLAHFGIITKKQSIRWDTLIRLAPPYLKESAIKISEVCHDIKGNDACDLAFNAAKCAYTNFPDVFFVM